MELEQIVELIDRVSASELDSFCLEQNGMRLSLKKKQPRKQTDPETQSTLVQLQKQSESPQEQSKQMSPVELTGTEPTKTEHTKTVVSPLVGIFYAAPAEDAEPFVQEGDGIEKGQTLGIVEAMKLMNELEGDSASKTGMTLNIAVNYGGRPEIVRAAQQLAARVAAGELKPEEITEEMMSDAMYTTGQKDPDFILRPSGEKRLSNFMLWQAAYSELVEMDVLWPDFTRDDLDAAITEFNKRSRRFGGI